MLGRKCCQEWGLIQSLSSSYNATVSLAGNNFQRLGRCRTNRSRRCFQGFKIFESHNLRHVLLSILIFKVSPVTRSLAFSQVSLGLELRSFGLKKK